MTNIDIARAYIQAVQAGDQAALGNLLSPEIIWHQPGNNRFSGTHKGIQAIGSLIGGMMEVSGGTFAITRANRYMANGDWVTVEIEFSGERDGETRPARYRSVAYRGRPDRRSPPVLK